jgi:hypothetical protein
VAERLVGHHRPQVGAADADVDDGADGAAGVPGPLAAAHPLRERAHPVEDRVHLADDVHPVDDERALARHPQGDVEHGAVLGDVDPLAGEHRLPPLGDAALLGQRDQQAQRLIGDPVLRVVETEAGALRDHPLAAPGVGGEQLAQVGLPGGLGVVGPEGPPGGALAQRAQAGAAQASSSRATSTTCSGVNPNLCWTSFSGAEAPNVCMATMRPAGPT